MIVNKTETNCCQLIYNYVFVVSYYYQINEYYKDK